MADRLDPLITVLELHRVDDGAGRCYSGCVIEGELDPVAQSRHQAEALVTAVVLEQAVLPAFMVEIPRLGSLPHTRFVPGTPTMESANESDYLEYSRGRCPVCLVESRQFTATGTCPMCSAPTS